MKPIGVYLLRCQVILCLTVFVASLAGAHTNASMGWCTALTGWWCLLRESSRFR